MFSKFVFLVACMWASGSYAGDFELLPISGDQYEIRYIAHPGTDEFCLFEVDSDISPTIVDRNADATIDKLDALVCDNTVVDNGGSINGTLFNYTGPNIFVAGKAFDSVATGELESALSNVADLKSVPQAPQLVP